MNLARGWPVVIAAIATWAVTSASVSAQNGIPDGVFVQEKTGTTWLILGGKRVAVPLWPASDAEIGAIPRSDRWAVMNDAGQIGAGEQPSWCGDWAPCFVRIDPPARPQEAVRRKRVGETFTLVGLSPETRGYRLAITINRVDFDVPEALRADDRGIKFSAFDITMRNEGSTLVKFSTLDFKVQTAEGFLTDYATRRVREPTLDDDPLGPGQVSRGWLAFQTLRDQQLESVIFQPSGSQQWVVADLRPQG